MSDAPVSDVPLHMRFRQGLAISPAALAIRDGDDLVRYDEAYDLALRWAASLRDWSADPGQAALTLTPRELDLLKLAAQGLANPDIGQQLVLGVPEGFGRDYPAIVSGAHVWRRRALPDGDRDRGTVIDGGPGGRVLL